MAQTTVHIRNAVGLHARPAAIFVETAKSFESSILVRCGDRTANAKSIINVLILGAEKDSVITIEAHGHDEAEAIKALESLVLANFQESR